MSDQQVVSWQLGRPARAFRDVAVHCPHGFPAVTRQSPMTADGTPFPTSYYLTCPWLVAAVSRIEADSGVARWTARAAREPELAASLADAQTRQRALRPELDVGIAGTANDDSLKCLHAHVAFAMAAPPYALGESVLAEIDEPWCSDGRCAAALDGDSA
ncbi:MAG: DUF501 domain-containing protein [Gaiellaceae bacterium]